MKQIKYFNGYDQKIVDAEIIQDTIIFEDDNDKMIVRFSENEIETFRKGIINYHMKCQVNQSTEFESSINLNGQISKNLGKIELLDLKYDKNKIKIEYEINGERLINTWEFL